MLYDAKTEIGNNWKRVQNQELGTRYTLKLDNVFPETMFISPSFINEDAKSYFPEAVALLEITYNSNDAGTESLNDADAVVRTTLGLE